MSHRARPEDPVTDEIDLLWTTRLYSGLDRVPRSPFRMSISPDGYPALTIRQPWADLILCGIKDVENRTWSTGYRGRLLIHGAKKVDWEAIEYLREDYGVVFPENYRPRTGALLGYVDVTDCVTEHESPFFWGPYGFALQNPKHFKMPVPYRGQLGIYEVPAEALLAAARAGQIQGPSQGAAASTQ